MCATTSLNSRMCSRSPQCKHNVALVTPNARFQSVASQFKRNRPLVFTGGRLHSITSEAADDVRVCKSGGKRFGAQRATCCVTDCNRKEQQIEILTNIDLNAFAANVTSN